MSTNREPTAVAVARAHVNAWSNHDFEQARTSLAPAVTITATSAKSNGGGTKLAGLDEYMAALEKFAGAVERGSTRVVAALGDEHNALLTLTLRASFAPGAPPVALTASRLYLVDDAKKIAAEQVIFFVTAEGDG